MMITFCSVNYKTDNLLQKNINLLSKFGYPFIIAENSPYRHKHELVTLIPGVDQSECFFPHGNIKGKGHRFDPGIHHSKALESCIDRATTEYVAVFDPDFFFIGDITELLGYDIIGAPHGQKSFHSVIKRHNDPAIDLYPGSFFCLLNKSRISTINVDWNKASLDFHNQHGGEQEPRSYSLIDTFYPMRQQAYKYNVASFTTCISKQCSICRSIIPDNMFRQGNPLERFFWNGKLVGLHFHVRDDRHIDLIESVTINHPMNDFTL